MLDPLVVHLKLQCVFVNSGQSTTWSSPLLVMGCWTWWPTLWLKMIVQVKKIWCCFKEQESENVCGSLLRTDQSFSRSRSQVIRIYWVHLCCSPSAGCSQSAGRFYQRAAVHLLRWSCVFRESTPSVGSLRFCLGETLSWEFEISFFGPVSTHLVSPWSLTPTSPLVFGSSVFVGLSCW